MYARKYVFTIIKDSCHHMACHRRHTGGVEIRLHSFLTLALDGVDDQSRFTLCKEPLTHCRGGWAGLRADLDGENLLSIPRIDLRTLQLVTSNPLRYPGPYDSYR